MKVFVLALLLASVELSCPGHKFCRQCESHDVEKNTCAMCDGTLKEAITKTCQQSSLQIADCEEYAIHPEKEEKETVCIRCRAGFFTSWTKCEPCMVANCAICKSPDTCNACKDGKKPNEDHTKCTDAACELEHCDQCEYLDPGMSPTCKKCKDGFAVAGDSKKCVATKKAHCEGVLAEANGDCTLCAAGYYLTKSWDCEPNAVTPQPGSKFWKVLLVLLIVGLLGAGAFYFYKHNAGSRRPNEPLIN